MISTKQFGLFIPADVSENGSDVAAFLQTQIQRFEHKGQQFTAEEVLGGFLSDSCACKCLLLVAQKCESGVCFCFTGTVKVKSSGIQVGDLIIVEKVCEDRLIRTPPSAFRHFECATYVTEKKAGSCQPLSLCRGERS